MARPKKDGRRATGIQGKRGFLYIVTSRIVLRDGVRKSEKNWIATGLTDTTENIKVASEMRLKLLNKENLAEIDRNVSVTDYVNLFISKKKREVSDTTYSGYFYKARRITEYFQATKLRDVKEVMVESFLDSLFEVHHASPRTVKDIKVLFGSVMEQAIKDGLISYNPVKEVVINKSLADQYSTTTNADDDFFSFEEAQLFLNIVKEHELYELFYLTLFFGLRREESLGLRWSAIDFKNKTMQINHTVTKGMTVMRKNTTKTASSARTYPLTDDQIAMFISLKEKESADRCLCGNCYIDSDYIFKHKDGSLYYPDYPTKAFGKIIKRHPELPQHITFHGLRSSCVSILVHQGNDVKSIQKWVGHADINTTLRIYAKVKEKDAKKEISDAMTDIIQIKNYTNEQPINNSMGSLLK